MCSWLLQFPKISEEFCCENKSRQHTDSTGCWTQAADISQWVMADKSRYITLFTEVKAALPLSICGDELTVTKKANVKLFYSFRRMRCDWFKGQPQLTQHCESESDTWAHWVWENSGDTKLKVITRFIQIFLLKRIILVWWHNKVSHLKFLALLY